MKDKWYLLIALGFVTIILISSSVLANEQDEEFKKMHKQFETALKMLQEGQVEQGNERLHNLYDKYSGEFEVTRYLSLSHAMMKEWEEAVRYGKETIDLNPSIIENPNFMFQLGEGYFRLEQFESTVTALEQGLKFSGEETISEQQRDFINAMLEHSKERASSE